MKCKSCGADIIWIVLPDGKKMPCDSQKIFYKQTFPKGTLTLVLPDGRIDRGEVDLESDKYGYISHFATCPSARFHRKKGKPAEVEDRQITIADWVMK
jgi:hypothetical protein